MHREVARLTGAGIDVVAVAGNHDHETLGRLAEEVEGFRVLGRGGRWETHEIVQGERRVVRIVGWSFPGSLVSINPMTSFVDPPDDLPVVGLLHCDLDGGDSHYAPVRRTDLEATPVAAWLLGHIHVPDRVGLAGDGERPDRPTGYLGSVVGLNPKESGPRGPWLVTLEGGSVELRHLPIAPLRWEREQFSLDGLGPEEGLESVLLQALEDVRGRVAATGEAVEAVGVRLELTGRTERSAEVHRLLETGDWRERILDTGGGVAIFLHRVDDWTRPPVDLDELARGNDPVGLLARRLKLLEAGTGGPDLRDLVDGARQAVRQTASRPTWGRLEPFETAAEDLAGRLLRGGWRLLEKMLAERGRGGE